VEALQRRYVELEQLAQKSALMEKRKLSTTSRRAGRRSAAGLRVLPRAGDDEAPEFDRSGTTGAQTCSN